MGTDNTIGKITNGDKMKKGQIDFGNKVEQLILKDGTHELTMYNIFETGDYVRVYNKEDCPIATYIIKVIK